jgi:cell volume regulation protein A
LRERAGEVARGNRTVRANATGRCAPCTAAHDDMISTDQILISASALLLFSLFASKLSARLGIPSLLIFLVVGMLAGSDGPGGIHFADYWSAQFLGIIALALILFAGGLVTRWEAVRPVLLPGLALSTAGVLLTAVLVGWFASAVFGFTLIEGLLLGAIVSSTDAAAVFSIMRSRNVSLREPLQPLLELESGSNDPMAVFLTVGLIQVLTEPGGSMIELVPLFVQQMLLGGAIGYGMGRAMVLTINHARLEYSGLYPALTLSLVTLVYGVTSTLGGNGFLAVYIAGIVLGGSNFIHKNSLVRFHDGLAWLMQIAMFLTLGLLAFPSKLVPIAGIALLVALFQVLIARPLAVFATLMPFRFTWREKTMVAWVGLRGAVPIVLATFPLLAGVHNAEMIFNVVFFAVLISVGLQGTSIPSMAKLLRVQSPLPPRPDSPLAFEQIEGVDADLTEFIIPPKAAVVGKPIVQVGMPHGTLITLICRDDAFLIPSGATILRGGDVVLVLANTVQARAVAALLSRPREPHSAPPA